MSLKEARLFVSDHEWPFRAVLIAGAGLLLGVIGDVLFYGYLPGINIFLFVLLFLVLGAALIDRFDQRIHAANALFVLPALFFAAMLAIRSAEYLNFFNAVVMLGSLFLAVCYLTRPRFLGGSISEMVTDAIQLGVLGWFVEPLIVVQGASQWTRTRKIKREQFTLVQAVARGCLIALPILIVFGVLLSSADAVFADYLDDLTGWIEFGSLEPLFSHLLVIGVFAWAVIAAYKVMLVGVYRSDSAASTLDSPVLESDAGLADRAKAVIPFRLGMIESGIILGSVDALFLVFVAIQARYFFGGEANITHQGYTYADYARRGFFELLAVSIFSLLIILVLDHLTERGGSRERLFRALVLGMIGLVLVILVSAFQRLSLYEDAYGFTRLRVVSHVFTVWLGVLFVLRAADLFEVFPRLFWLGGLICAFGFFATLNVMNVDAFIAERNIERFHKTGKLDVYYLTQLSDDAIPAMVSLLDELDELESGRDGPLLGSHLRWRWQDLNRQREQRELWGFHYGADQAWKALDKKSDVLLND